jgi:class 3 adenylate cyclase
MFAVSDAMDIGRKVVAVFAADVEGSSRLMGADELGTLKGLTARRAVLDRLIGEHRGRIANTAGDQCPWPSLGALRKRLHGANAVTCRQLETCALERGFRCGHAQALRRHAGAAKARGPDAGRG